MTERSSTVTTNFLRQRLSRDLSRRVLDRYEAGFYEDAVLNAFKTTLKAEINADARDTINSVTSRPFGKPESGRIAVKVINHLGDEGS